MKILILKLALIVSASLFWLRPAIAQETYLHFNVSLPSEVRSIERVVAMYHGHGQNNSGNDFSYYGGEVFGSFSGGVQRIGPTLLPTTPRGAILFAIGKFWNDDQDHVILGVNTSTALQYQGREWETLFGYPEQYMVDLLHKVGTSTESLGQYWLSEWLPAVDSSTQTWMTVPAVGTLSASPDGYFVAFSEGQLLAPVHAVSSLTAPVPEPETYAMLLAGLALIGSVMRRRSRRRALASA